VIFFKLDLRESTIHGKGLFAGEAIPRGSIVVNWLDERPKFVREHEHLELIKDPILSRSSIRLAGDHFIYGDELEETDHINHSDDPNLLYFAGVLYAKKEIAVGDELTIDYRYLNSEHEHDVVKGYGARYALLTSAQELLALLGL